MKTYIMESGDEYSEFTGSPSQIIDQMTTQSKLAFKNREDMRRTYASLVSDYSGNPVRFGSDDDFIEDLIEFGVLEEKNEEK